jgi:hypothetical protein
MSKIDAMEILDEAAHKHVEANHWEAIAECSTHTPDGNAQCFAAREQSATAFAELRRAALLYASACVDKALPNRGHHIKRLLEELAAQEVAS